MTPSEFVQGLEAHCSQSAVEATISQFRHPSGRRPSTKLLRLSKWYQSLGEPEQALLREAMDEVSAISLFGVLCVLDGARKAHAGRDISFRLSVTVDGMSYELMDPSGPDLHDLLRRPL